MRAVTWIRASADYIRIVCIHCVLSKWCAKFLSDHCDKAEEIAHIIEQVGEQKPIANNKCADCDSEVRFQCRLIAENKPKD